MPKKTKADKLFSAKIEQILAAEKRLEKRVIDHQRKLLDLITKEFLPKFDIDKNGFIKDSKKNDKLIVTVSNLFDKLEKVFYRDVIGTFAADLLKSAESSAAYYVALGFKKKVVADLLRNKVRLEQRIGITPSGRIVKNGYLYQLGQTGPVRRQITDYVVASLTGDVPFLDFQLGLRNLVIGNRRTKGLATNGALQKYFDQFAYDAFSQMDAVANKQLATNLNLTHFIYEGSLIDTSRKFCIKRAGKAYSVEDTKTWASDPDLPDKKTKSRYQPLIDRGRYRCRHFLKYITEATYKLLTDNADSDRKN